MFRFKLQGGLARKEQGLWLILQAAKYVTLYLYCAVSQDFRVKSSDRPPPYSYQFILLNLLSVNVPQSSSFLLRQQGSTSSSAESIHLMTTSRNLFQSAGLNRLSNIASPLISFIKVASKSRSTIFFLSLLWSSTSIKHFSSKLQNSQRPTCCRFFSYTFLSSSTTFPFSVFVSYISG